MPHTMLQRFDLGEGNVAGAVLGVLVATPSAAAFPPMCLPLR